MKREDAFIGQLVRSKVNPIYRGDYKIVKLLKTVCHVMIENDTNTVTVYKNNRYSILEPSNKRNTVLVKR